MSLKKLAALCSCSIVLLLCSRLGAEELAVQLKISQAAERLQPFGEPAIISVAVATPDGKPGFPGQITIRIQAPRRGRLLSTDFPLVEGTRLLEVRLPIDREGRAEWKFLFPIRGDYEITTEAAMADGRRTTRSFRITVRENEKKWVLLGAFSVALLLLGIIAGRIFTTAGKSVVGLCLCLGILLALFGESRAQPPAQPGDFVGRLEVEPATVGKPTRLYWRLDGDGKIGKANSRLLTLTITHQEKQKTVFSIEKVPVAGEFAMSFHFPDGADYRITAIAEGQAGEPIRVERTITVTALEAPAGAMVFTVAIFLAVIAFGLVLGRVSRRVRPS